MTLENIVEFTRYLLNYSKGKKYQNYVRQAVEMNFEHCDVHDDTEKYLDCLFENINNVMEVTKSFDYGKLVKYK